VNLTRIKASDAPRGGEEKGGKRKVRQSKGRISSHTLEFQTGKDVMILLGRGGGEKSRRSEDKAVEQKKIIHYQGEVGQWSLPQKWKGCIDRQVPGNRTLSVRLGKQK